MFHLTIRNIHQDIMLLKKEQDVYKRQASSIMSKKLASGADTILLDVKYGNGAFMQTLEDAKKLAQTMIDIGKHCHKDTRATISSMSQPLGKAIGNSLEVIEAIETLKGNGPQDLEELCLKAGSTMPVSYTHLRIKNLFC